MENKPLHYNGSVQNLNEINLNNSEDFELTDEMRKSISGNPYTSDITE